MALSMDAGPPADIGILGGTGLYEIDGLQDVREVPLHTPFGSPSDAFVTGTLEGRRVAFLSRHGRGHRFLPAEVNYRANVFGFKMLGVRKVISVSSVGSLKEEVRPRDILLADQFYDRTRRPNTFFGDGIVAHIGLARPVCPALSRALYEIGTGLGLQMHLGGTYICIEGPAFSTIAESRTYRSWGCDIIGMTGATEARLFREAEICYATLNLVTDYDVWREEGESVSVNLILENLSRNIENAKALVRKAVASLPEGPVGACECADALRGAIVTKPAFISRESRDRLKPLIGKYLP